MNVYVVVMNEECMHSTFYEMVVILSWFIMFLWLHKLTVDIINNIVDYCFSNIKNFLIKYGSYETTSSGSTADL